MYDLGHTYSLIYVLMCALIKTVIVRRAGRSPRVTITTATLLVSNAKKSSHPLANLATGSSAAGAISQDTKTQYTAIASWSSDVIYALEKGPSTGTML